MRITIFILISVAAVFAQSVAVFVPHDLFREDEFERILYGLDRANFSVVIVSSDTAAAQGIDGVLIKPDQLIKDLTPEGFAGLILVDGSGIVSHWKDTVLQERCRQFAAAGRLVAAIELAPIILARAGILEGKKATVFPDHYSINILKEGGCHHRFDAVVTDGNIITAARAEHTPLFVRTIVKKLKGK
ncbi:MAG: DJ-1/PfpI family protein [bacterium]